ncbi:hypothetical protein LTR53_001526 [Teratosphaeriaceae sp. CCFEE 6253]|nr:hypothetical protein LTR53_001526 [Teratosphaeriaceae sp. CCFEE 6253]
MAGVAMARIPILATHATVNTAIADQRDMCAWSSHSASLPVQVTQYQSPTESSHTSIHETALFWASINAPSKPHSVTRRGAAEVQLILAPPSRPSTWLPHPLSARQGAHRDRAGKAGLLDDSAKRSGRAVAAPVLTSLVRYEKLPVHRCNTAQRVGAFVGPRDSSPPVASGSNTRKLLKRPVTGVRTPAKAAASH